MKIASTSVLFSSMILAVAPLAATTITFGGTNAAGQGIVSNTPSAYTVTFASGEPSNYSNGAVVSSNQSGIYSAPYGDDSNYLTTGTGTITINLSQNPVSYFGLYWGSPDGYNTVTLSGPSGSESYTGSQIESLYNPASCDPNSVYVNFFAGAGKAWNKITLSSTQNAFESDNHAFITATPEPSSAILLGGGLLVAAVFCVRKRSAADVG